MLVIESAGRRHRFPAMPEPPSLTGTGPGMWRMSFTVPGWLASDLGGRTWLQFGAVVVPLPAAIEPPAPSTTEAESQRTSDTDAEQLRSLGLTRGAELETERARRWAQEAEAATVELTRRVHELERDLQAARRHSEDLATSLAERELTRRAAEQRAHAERALRQDLGRRVEAGLAEKEKTRQALGELAAAEERIRALELELVALRRRGDEAEQVAAAAATARERAERRAEQAAETLRRSTVPPTVQPRATADQRVRFEHALMQRRAGTSSRVASEPPARSWSPAGPSAPADPYAPGDSSSLADSSPLLPGATASAAGSEALIGALRRELDLRAAAEAALRGRVIDAEGRLAARGLIASRTTATLAELRQELDGLRAAFQRERAARVRAERQAVELSADVSGQRERSQHAYQAIDQLRGALGALRLSAADAKDADARAKDPGGDAEDPGASVEEPDTGRSSDDPGPASGDAPSSGEPGNGEPDRFNDARVRLREAIAPAGADADAEPGNAELGDAEPGNAETGQEERTAVAWLQPVFKTLVRTDADAAGRLLLELLPAQWEAYPERVTYDLMLGGRRGCAQVTVRDGAPMIRYDDDPRSAKDVDFQVVGAPAALARLLTAGAIRRRLRRGIARVRGRRDGLEALRALVAVRLDLRGLHRAGVRLDPRMTLKLVALVIEPGWTARARFNLAYEDDQGEMMYLLVHDGRPVRVSGEAPAGRIETRISGPADALALLLAGQRDDRIAVTGEEWPVALLRKWIKRAQSD